jgi:hypothetical protein
VAQVTPQEADYLLAEWAQWQAGDCINIGYPRSTPFGRLIKPDPMPSRVPIDEARALRTDRAIAQLTGRRRFMLKMHYLGREPIDAKARRLKIGRKEYQSRIQGICGIIAHVLDPPRNAVAIRTRNVVVFVHAASLPPGGAEAQGADPSSPLDC